MTQNTSHVVVHHYFDNASGDKLFGMTCCIILSVVIILILVIILAIVIYMLLRRKKRNPEEKHTGPEQHPYAHKSELSSIRRNGITNPAASFEDTDIDINSNRHSIPMSVIRTSNNAEDLSESSAGLCDVLFPQQHNGEIIRDPPPPRTVAFDYPDTTRNRIEPEPSRHSTGVSMEWDYHELRRYQRTGDSVSDRIEVVDICWV